MPLLGYSPENKGEHSPNSGVQQLYLHQLCRHRQSDLVMQVSLKPRAGTLDNLHIFQVVLLAGAPTYVLPA